MATLNIKPLTTVGGGNVNLLSNLPSTTEKNKQWQRELLMERIRSHSSQHKTFQELSKGMRMGMLEKRYPLDAVEKSNLQKCLDNMQHCIKVTSRQGLVERLESLSRQLSLKFSDDSKALFISTDMFYLEIILDSNGSLTDVKVHHESKVEQQSCSELVDCLNRGDFADFTAQLEGFSSIYQLNAESKVKIKAYDAMLAMETDLYNIFQMQNFSKDTGQVLQDSAVGIVMQRRGGHPMRLVYFVSPYDLISLETKSLQPITLDTFSNKKIGFSVTVNLEASSANKLQIMPTVTFSKDPQTGMDTPVFAPLTQMNSMLLPATFVLRLNKPLPVCYNTMRAMGLCMATAGMDSNPSMSATSSLESQNKPPVIDNIMNLVIQTASEQQTKSNQKGLLVCLPDQTHCYYFTENKLMKSTLIHSVPFTEPSQVQKILEFLKKMALFYSLLASCVRPQTKMGIDMDSTTVLEVNAISFQQISVALQHPYEESMATVEFDLRSGMPQCSIFSLSKNYDLLSIKLTNIAQKCLSIPVTIRALLKYWDQERMKMFQRGLSGNSAAIGSTGGSSNISSGASGGSGMGSNTHGSYGHFNITGPSNDPGGGLGRMSTASGGGGGCGLQGGVNIKMETNAIVAQQRLSSQIPAASSSFSKYKSGEIKQEDFHESPKSQPTTMSALTATDSMTGSNLMQSNLELNSLGHHHQQQQKQLEQQIADHDIADKYKNIWKDKTNLKNTVSITPIHGENSNPSPLDVKRTGGIEIIPLTGQTPSNTSINSASNATNSMNNSSTTITITPINTSSSSSTVSTTACSTSLISGIKDKKLSTSSSSSSMGSTNTTRSLESSDGQKDKKRKKRRDDSPMGPPEKIFSRQNSPAGSSEAAATAVARKFSSPSSSPKGSSGGLLASSVSGSSLSTRPSPKHSPVYSSPKHNTASNSPKSPFGTHSPKHGSSGKPSMSTLKSATAASPKEKQSNSSPMSASSVLSSAALVRSLTTSSSSSSSSSGSGSSSSSSSSSSANAKAAAAAAVKSSMGVTSMQQMKSLPGLNIMTAAAASNFAGGSNSGLDLNSAMRKGVAAAVSLMTSTQTMATISKSQASIPSLVSSPHPSQAESSLEPQGKVKQQRPPQALTSLPGTNEDKSLKIKLVSSVLETENNIGGKSGGCSSVLNNNSEYMVKSSQEGLKLTINKTSTTLAKVSNSSSSVSSKSQTKSKQNSGSLSGHHSSTGSSKKFFQIIFLHEQFIIIVII
ncbi:mediator complex subunit 1 isoform X2 [Haematobia irritans]|uniref:mediator complex subunit 1 isoform X2 n=1 Tax=Haematobia irritans TaxID=7368 RepID=UPI003F508358